MTTEMNFVCKPVETIALSESFEFKWIIDSNFSSKLSSQEIVSTLSDGVRFKIIVVRGNLQYDGSSNRCIQRSRLQYERHGHHAFGHNYMRVGLRKTDETMCDSKALLLFEICNYAGELYLKESVAERFSKSEEEHLSDAFICPTINQEIQGRNGGYIYFPDCRITIKGMVFIQCCQEKKVSDPPNENICQLQNNLKDLFENKIYADVKFHIGDHVISAHKNILSSRSEVFRRMFEQNMKEKEASIVKVTDIEKSVFYVFLIFLYTGTVQDDKLDIVMPLYSVADKYAVDSLLKTCSRILASYISDATVAPILKLADMHSDDILKKTAIDFICKNFSQVEITHSWDTLLNSDPRLASYALKQVSMTAAKYVSSKKESTPPKKPLLLSKLTRRTYDEDEYEYE